MTVPCSIDISGKILTISAANGRLIAQILVEGPFEPCLKNAAQNMPIEKGRANIYRGELLPLENHEYLDLKNQEILEKNS